jgi:hypothetical protein
VASIHDERTPSVLRASYFSKSEDKLFSTSLVEAPIRVRYISYVRHPLRKDDGGWRQRTCDRGNT